MYAHTVERIVRKGFRQLSRGQAGPVVALFADNAELHFPGVHALAASCKGKADISAWFERLLRVLPGIQFEIHEVVVHGFPWNTRVFTRFTDTVPAPGGGTPLVNHGVQVLRLRWGRIVQDTLYLDTQVVAAACARAQA